MNILNPKQNDIFSFERTLNAPKELIFSLWQNEEHFAKWWGPAQTELILKQFDFQEGGTTIYGMMAPDGNSMYGKFIYQKIEKPNLIEFIVSFSDENGKTIRAPFFEDWPLEVYNKVSFIDENGLTKMIISGFPINANQNEIDRYISMFESMNQGFSGTFKQLEDYLKTLI